MYLSTACDSHTFQPATATATEPLSYEDNDEDAMAVDLPAGPSGATGEAINNPSSSSLSVLGSSISATAMDVDNASNPTEPSLSNSKCTHSLMSSESGPASSLGIAISTSTSLTPLSSEQLKQLEPVKNVQEDLNTHL